MRIYKNVFNKITSTENLFLAWDEFKVGKGLKLDVEAFEAELEKHIFTLHRELRNKTYKHASYEGFFISDPKRRHIHKALVRDRVLHHAVFKILNPIFEPAFIANSFSCRVGKGTHKGVEAASKMLQQVSQNNTKTCHALKCDIQKFFDSVDHQTLMTILDRKIRDKETLSLLKMLIESYTIAVPLQRERERERERE